MLCGYPPFYGDDKFQTGQKILRWREFLEFPKGVDAISPAAVDLITGLLTDPSHRLTYEQIVAHPFFASIDWATLRAQPAPFRISLTSATDTRYFDQNLDDDNRAGAAPKSNPLAPDERPSDDARYLFYGFTSKFDHNGTTVAARGGKNPSLARPALQTFADDDA